MEHLLNDLVLLLLKAVTDDHITCRKPEACLTFIGTIFPGNVLEVAVHALDPQYWQDCPSTLLSVRISGELAHHPAVRRA